MPLVFPIFNSFMVKKWLEIFRIFSASLSKVSTFVTVETSLKTLVGILGEMLTSWIHSEFNWPLSKWESVGTLKTKNLERIITLWKWDKSCDSLAVQSLVSTFELTVWKLLQILMEFTPVDGKALKVHQTDVKVQLKLDFFWFFWFFFF
mgnify:CR=1 FL=1